MRTVNTNASEKGNESSLFSGLRQASRALTNLYNGFMPEVDIATSTVAKKRIQVKVTQLVVLKALYDTSWWNDMRERRIKRSGSSRRDRLKDYYSKHPNHVVQVDLAEHLSLDCTTVCRNLKALLESGWIASERSDINMREMMVFITESGRAVVEKADAEALEATKMLRAKLGDELWHNIEADMAKLCAMVQEISDECSKS